MPARRVRSTLEETAFHEAGHAVVGTLLGLTLNNVDIRRVGERNGVCAWSPLLYGDPRQRKVDARGHIVTSFAGMEAQRLVNPDADDAAGSDDRHVAFTLSVDHAVLPRGCRVVGDDNHHAYLRKLEREAHKAVKAYRPMIERVAKVLLQKRRLTGDDVRGMVAPLGPRSCPTAKKV